MVDLVQRFPVSAPLIGYRSSGACRRTVGMFSRHRLFPDQIGSTTLTTSDPSDEAGPSQSSAPSRRRVPASTSASLTGALPAKRKVKSRAPEMEAEIATASEVPTDPAPLTPNLSETSPVTGAGGSNEPVARSRTRAGAARRSATSTPKASSSASGPDEEPRHSTDIETETTFAETPQNDQTAPEATDPDADNGSGGGNDNQGDQIRDHDMSRTDHSTTSVQASSGFNPGNLEIVLLSFEGPDQPYSMAGGLGVRVTELAQALAESGFRTHLIFVGIRTYRGMRCNSTETSTSTGGPNGSVEATRTGSTTVSTSRCAISTIACRGLLPITSSGRQQRRARLSRCLPRNGTPRRRLGGPAISSTQLDCAIMLSCSGMQITPSRSSRSTGPA